MPELPEPKVRPHPKQGTGHQAFGTNAQGHMPRAYPFHQYAELHVTSNFTFLTGASHPDELVMQAAQLGYQAIAITDKNSLAGIVRAHLAAKEVGIPLAVGCRLELIAPWVHRTTDGHELARRANGAMAAISTHDDESHPQPILVHPCPSIVPHLSILVYPTDRSSYARLCHLLTVGKRRAPKGECHLWLHDLLEYHAGLLAVVIPPPTLDQSFIDVLIGLRSHFGDDRLSLAMSCAFGGDDRVRLQQLATLAEHVGIPIVATNDVHYHVSARRPLQDVLTCIRHGCTIEQAGYKLFPNAERYLKPPEVMAELFAAYPQALARSVELAKRAAAFSLDELKYQYPDEVVPVGMTPMQYLVDLTWKGAAERYGEPEHISDRVRKQIEHEFRLIDELNYAPYFLTVYDIVKEARSRQILCQGRGAAANSAVCYCLGITAVDPDRIDVLFERFVSKERNEPPDIDVDFEHERREEIIQYIYNKYGRHRAGLTAEVITYRGRSAVRDVGKAMGLSLDCVDRLAKHIEWWSSGVTSDHWKEVGLNPNDPTMRRVLGLTDELLGFPRHLSQHVGGFVITREPLCNLVPIENAAMEDRTVIEWDKDDIDAMGMLKIDVLGLGMLTCIRKGLAFVNEVERTRHEGTEARRHEGTLHLGDLQRRVEHEWEDSNISRLDCMAEGDGISADDLSSHQVHACGGAVRFDASDETSDRVSPVKYFGGVCQTEYKGLSEASADCPGFTCRTGDAIRIERHTGVAQPGSGGSEPAGRNRSRLAGADSKYRSENKENVVTGTATRRHTGTKSSKNFSARDNLVAASLWDPNATEASNSPSCLSPPPCLRASVPSSLPSFPLHLHTIPPEDPAVYDMICAADTVGVFQIESRAQMSMLPRLRPRCFYDLVIEVAIVRPGPIQGDMVHPYLRRRNGQEKITYPDERVKKVLAKTLGVPLFQEQAMSLAIVAAGFTPGEADQLRRAIAAWKTKGNKIAQFGERLMSGMVANGYDPNFAHRCFEQIKGFSGYGFPESHAASFALLVYVSAWLKCHYPAAFAAALLNSQPMGFYAPAQIVRDARDHGVPVLPIDVNHSAWDCTLEEICHGEHGDGTKATFDSSPCTSCAQWLIGLRLGMRLIRGLSEVDAHAIANAAKSSGPFTSIDTLHRASGVRISLLRKLASADAFNSMGLDRQHALWQVRALRDEKLPIFETTNEHEWTRIEKNALHETHHVSTGCSCDLHPIRVHPCSSVVPSLPPVSEFRKVSHDCAATGLSLRAHPISFIRENLNSQRVTSNGELKDESRWPHGTIISVAGLALVRQRPSTANGIIFMTLEDETGIANLILRPTIYKTYRRAARHGVVVKARGRVERQAEVVHIVVRELHEVHLTDSPILPRSRDFH